MTEAGAGRPMQDPQGFAFPRNAPLLFVLSGPSGVGKDAALALLRQRHPEMCFPVTCTTRAPRDREADGVDYYFHSVGEFEAMIARGDLLEWARVYDRYYGVPKSELRRAAGLGRDAMLKVDVQGAMTVRRVAPPAILVFMAPGSYQDLADRIGGRPNESGARIDLRLETAREEMATLSHFDYLVVNRDRQLDRAVDQIEAIIWAERSRVAARVFTVD